MNYILYILFPFLSLCLQQKDPAYYNKEGKPSSQGILKYIMQNEKNIISEYEYKVDSIYDVYIFTEDMEGDDSLDMGHFYIPDQIAISMSERYSEYEFKNLSKSEQREASYYLEKTVNAVIFHELTHVYIRQTRILLAEDTTVSISSAYNDISSIMNPQIAYGASFIEEGICEYTVCHTGEDIFPKNPWKPRKEEDFLRSDLNYPIKYVYSIYFLKEFLDEYGLKRGIEILLINKPPAFKEILEPNLFFNRLIIK
jgi:hypothetical protein